MEFGDFASNKIDEFGVGYRFFWNFFEDCRKTWVRNSGI